MPKITVAVYESIRYEVSIEVLDPSNEEEVTGAFNDALVSGAISRPDDFDIYQRTVVAED